MTRAARSPRLLAAAALLAALLSGACGVDADSEPRVIPDDDLRASQADDVTTTTASDTRDKPIGAPVAVSVFFAQAGPDDGKPHLVTKERNVSSPATEDQALDALLLEPPTGQERADGVVTAIPSTTRQVRPPRDQGSGVVLVSLTSGLFDVEGQSLKVAFGQIVCSVTSLGRADWVLIEVDGDVVPVIDGTGKQVDGPVACDSYDALQPA